MKEHIIAMDIENLDTHIKRISSITGYGLNIEER